MTLSINNMLLYLFPAHHSVCVCVYIRYLKTRCFNVHMSHDSVVNAAISLGAQGVFFLNKYSLSFVFVVN